MKLKKEKIKGRKKVRTYKTHRYPCGSSCFILTLASLARNFINTSLLKGIVGERQYNCSSRGADRCRPKPPLAQILTVKMSSLLFATILVACVLVASHAAPPDQTWTEEPISYSGFQLWSATPRSVKEREFLVKIRQDYGNEIILCSVTYWKYYRLNSSCVK